MRIVATFIISAIVGFLAGDGFRILEERKQKNYGWYILLTIPFLVLGSYWRITNLYNDDVFWRAYLPTAFIGIAIGIFLHHLLYHGWVGKYLPDRLWEILPGLLTWLFLTSPLWLSLRFPLVVSYGIIFLDFYWFFRGLKILVNCYTGYQKMQSALKKDWLSIGKSFPEFSKIYHLVVIPTFKESREVLETTFTALAKSDYPHEKIMIILGIEEADKDNGLKIAQELQKKYNKDFKKIFVTVHKLLPEEIQGPAANRTFGLKQVLPEIEKMGIALREVLLTTLDADFAICPKFLSAVTATYLATPKRDKRSFTGVFLYNNNYWQAAAPMRVIASGTAFWQLAEMVGSDKYQNFASMSINLQTVVDLGFWPTNIVNDDSAFYWRAYYYFKGDYKVIPHFLPISCDTVQDVTLWKSFTNQYNQLKRWAYGVEHAPYIAKKYLQIGSAPFWDKTDKFVFWMRSNVIWGTLPIILGIGIYLVSIARPDFGRTSMAYILPKTSSVILTLALIGVFLMAILNEKFIPPRPKNWGYRQKILSYAQWLLSPLIVLTWGTFPALASQTRLMLGKYMGFKVTVKTRSKL